MLHTLVLMYSWSYAIGALAYKGHPRNLFRRPWNFGLSSLKHHTWPYHASVLWYMEANLSFQMQERNFPRPYLRNDTMDFLFLNDGNLDKCLSKKKIHLATPALWLSSPHWAKCLTKSKFLETACKNYCTHTSALRHVRVPRSRNFSDCWLIASPAPASMAMHYGRVDR